MPIYEYRCPNGHVFEQFKRMSDPPPEQCEVCGASPLELVLYPVAIHYKGSGFYSTDYGKSKTKPKEETGTPKRRLRYANDPAVLLAVSGAPNEAKGDSDASGWLPTRSFRCRYVAVQISIKTEYHLWVTPGERVAMAGVLAHCASAHG